MLWNQRLKLYVVSVGVASLVLLSGLPAVGGQQKTKTLKGSFDGVGNDFSGHFTHLGKFTGVFDPDTFTAVWTRNNGDTVQNSTTSFVIDFENPVGPNTFPYVQSIEITGGTGKFENATGWADIVGTINVVTGAFDGDLDGEITTAK